MPIVIAIVPVSYLLGVRSILLLIVVAAAASLVAGLFDPALQAALPEIYLSPWMPPRSSHRLARSPSSPAGGRLPRRAPTGSAHRAAPCWTAGGKCSTGEA